MRTSVSLSKLVAGRISPRRVKPEREAHRRLVASIRAHRLIYPLVVRKIEEGKEERYQVIAGNRRLAALREIHRGDGDLKIACEVRDVEDPAAEKLSLAENFAREAMHPLDEAEAFARLAVNDGKDGEGIAAEFGVTPRYVRQRIKLATLAEVIKAAYRENKIDTGTAEAFAAVPPQRQEEVWKEVNGNPRHADQVRNIIANAWVDARHALFDPASLPESAVSRDLFNDRVLIERQAFMDAQVQAMGNEGRMLKEAGWKEIVVGSPVDVQDRLWTMAEAEPIYDAETTRKLEKLERDWEKQEAKGEKIEADDEEAFRVHQQKLEDLEAEQERLRAEAPRQHSKATKARGTVFLTLDVEGQVGRHYRVPKPEPKRGGNGVDNGGGVLPAEAEALPTSEELSDGQLATTFTQQALMVREALLHNPAANKRVLALILHDKVRGEALAVGHEANAVTLHADNTEGFASPALAALRKQRKELDPLGTNSLADHEAYAKLGKLSEAKLNALIDLLVVECLTAHLQRRTELVDRLATELEVDFRKQWRPDAGWLGSYQKVQLAHLIAELKGPASVPSADRKKSELVAELEKLITYAVEGKREVEKRAERIHRWLPANLRPQKAAKETAEAKAT